MWLNFRQLNPIINQIISYPKNILICSLTSYFLLRICWTFFLLFENSFSNPVVFLCAQNFSKKFDRWSSRDFCQSFQRFLNKISPVFSKTDSCPFKHLRLFWKIRNYAIQFIWNKFPITWSNKIRNFIQEISYFVNRLNILFYLILRNVSIYFKIFLWIFYFKICILY
jgi:hypothetical protein